MRVVSGNQWAGEDDALRTPLWPIVRDALPPEAWPRTSCEGSPGASFMTPNVMKVIPKMVTGISRIRFSR